ncbi:MAG: rane protein [Segetibacter sp.]|nr:rane protein [Segetibacter sp.]
MNFNKINNIVGWIVCIIASGTYILTAELSGSLWDSGEFVSSAFKLQIPHPPGAPLFVLLGRFFIILFGDNPNTAAKAVNVMSAMASGFTILFLFWTITHFARKIVQKGEEVLSNNQLFSIMGAGAVGALAYTFSDSFWYSAVEGEVYALSSFFTAIVFWAILKWEHAVDQEERTGINADRWIIFIFFMMGLSIGVHLLNLLTLPAIVMVYYYKRYNVTKWGTLWAFLIGCVITGVVQTLVIQYSIAGAGYFDIFFVNSLGLPFFTGFTAYFLILGVLVYMGLRFKEGKLSQSKLVGWIAAVVLMLLIPAVVKSEGSGSRILKVILAIILIGAAYMMKPERLKDFKLAIWCFAFMLIGYSTYITTMIRSNADPAVDMYNVDNPMSLVGYLGREQYGDFPLLYGQKFTAQPVDYKETSTKYIKANGRYEQNGKDGHYVYEPEKMMLFPRVWDASNDQGHADYYASYLGIGRNQQDGSYERDPNFGDNIKFFMGYQVYWMYFRYFMWNFSGKQNDVQGVFAANIRDGNWITGIPFIDNLMYGDQSLMPDSSKNNKAHNTLFLLPFILGVIGIYYQYKQHKRDSFIVFLLFFFTGFAIVLYLNQAGNQPRERDYAYVGSFYAFAIWIGLGVLQVRDWLAKVMSRGIATNVATVACLLAVPVLMAAQEWDDHDRSRKVLARDLAIDYLESCAPNAILFTFGDNDTYPLWYAQEVEGIRRDIRVINYSLLGIDWYINQMRYKVNQSDPIDVIWSKEQIQGRKRDYIRYAPQPGIPENQYFDLYDLMKNYVGSEDPAKMVQAGADEMINTFPVKRVSIPVDLNLVKQNGTVGLTDKPVAEVRFEIPKQTLMKNDLAVLNVIAANQWKRPIYFTSAFDELGFGAYLRKDGLSYRLVPVMGEQFNTDYMKDKLMNKFAFGNANVPNVYFDEENRRHLNSIRTAYAELAFDLSSKGRKEEAVNTLEKADKMMLQENFPYGHISRGNMHNRTSLAFLQSCYQAGAKDLAKKVANSVRTDLQQQIKFYNSLQGNKAEWMAFDKRNAEELLNALQQMDQMFNIQSASPEAGGQVITPGAPAPRPDRTEQDTSR